VGVAVGFEGAGVGDLVGSLGATGPGDDGALGVDVEVELDVELDWELGDDEAPPLVLLVGSELDSLSAPCENVPRLGLWSRSSSSAWLL